MTRGLQRATFNRSALVRVLSDSRSIAPDPKYVFGERLGQWLGFPDALMLFSVLNNEAGSRTSANPDTAAQPVTQPVTPLAAQLATQLAQIKHQLSSAIQYNGVFSPAPPQTTVRIPFPTPLPNATPESATDFSPYHRYYLAHQRDMNNAITALRASTRRALAGHSPAGRQLAELDAAFERCLSSRERNLLANIPILLSKRFSQRYAEHCAANALEPHTDDRGDDPARWTQAGSWLEAFCHDVQTALISELELRLKPVAGLIAGLIAMPGSTTESPAQ